MTPPPVRRYQHPPQYVMVSFDGSGDPKLLEALARRRRLHPRRFSFFVSGVYLLDRAQAVQ